MRKKKGLNRVICLFLITILSHLVSDDYILLFQLEDLSKANTSMGIHLSVNFKHETK